MRGCGWPRLGEGAHARAPHSHSDALADYQAARSRAEESAAFFRSLQAGPSLAEVLVTLGRVQDAQGEAAQAWGSLTEALTLARAKGPRFVVAAALDELGMLAVRQREAQRGVSLLAAAAALRRTMGTPVRPADRPVLESALAAARAALGDRSCDEAWAAGQGQPLEQVSARIVTALADAAGAAKRARVA